MNSVMNTVTAYYKAIGDRDAKALRSVLADEFSFSGPLMSFDAPSAFVEAMMALPFEAVATDSRFIVNEYSRSVAHVFQWKMSAPAKVVIPMCEVLLVADGRVKRSELFYDSKLFPTPEGHS